MEDDNEQNERVTKVNEENFYDFELAIISTAKQAANRFPEVLWEDVAQELWVWVLTQDKFDSPDDDGFATALYWLGKRAAANERAGNLSVSAQYGYTTDELKILLADAFSRTDWVNATEDNLCDQVTVYSDISWGYSQLSHQYQCALLEKFVLGIVHDSGTKERKTLNRAVGRLADILNTYSREGVAAGPTARRVISNGQAQAAIDSDY